jgi:hypothetical protein
MMPVWNAIAELQQRGQLDSMGKASKIKRIRKIAASMPGIGIKGGGILNHERKMKAMYNKHGAAGVNNYIQAVKNFTDAV